MEDIAEDTGEWGSAQVCQALYRDEEWMVE